MIIIKIQYIVIKQYIHIQYIVLLEMECNRFSQKVTCFSVKLYEKGLQIIKKRPLDAF